jgi:hypothetical protein
MVWKRHPFKVVLSMENKKTSAGANSGEWGGKRLLGLIPENGVDGVQRMSDVLSNNCG